MHIKISLNPKHETDRITAFLNQLSCYGHEVVIVFGSADLIDQNDPPSMDNLPMRRHHLSFVDRVVYLDGATETELYRAGK